MKPRLELIEKEVVTKTFTIQQDGAAFDLTGYTVTFLARDQNAAKSTLLFPAITATITGATSGTCTVAFTATETDMPTAGDDLIGEFTLKLEDAPDVTRYTKYGILHLIRNDFEAA